MEQEKQKKQKTYKFPSFDLGSSWLHMRINLSTNSIQTKYQVTVLTALSFAFGFLLYWGILTETPIHEGGVVGITIFSIGYWYLCYLLLVPTPNQRLGCYYFMPSFYYLLKKYRHIHTLATSDDVPLELLYGIKGLYVNESGICFIIFNNNDVGQVYEIIGNGSRLMFDDDLNNLLENAKRFYKNISTNTYLVYDTTLSPQRVDIQLNNLKNQEKNNKYCTNSKDGLRKVYYQNYQVLDKFVGEKFRSIRQYLIVGSVNEEGLLDFNQRLQNSVGSPDSGNITVPFLKSARLLDKSETEDYLNNLFTIQKKGK